MACTAHQWIGEGAVAEISEESCIDAAVGVAVVTGVDEFRPGYLLLLDGNPFEVDRNLFCRETFGWQRKYMYLLVALRPNSINCREGESHVSSTSAMCEQMPTVFAANATVDDAFMHECLARDKNYGMRLNIHGGEFGESWPLWG